jgi:YidC/Oxa1 family membrane protein insertase
MKSAALQGLMDLRAEKKSIRLFNYLHSKSIFPTPYAYLFILLALALAIKVLSLPFLVHGAKASLAIPKLRGEYQRLKAQYSGDAVGFSSAITNLYKRHGVNPYAGCAKIFVDIGFVVWVMLTLKNYAPQLTLDGAKFLWTSSVTERDLGVLIMWLVAGMLMLFLTPQIEQGQTAQLACASLAILGIIAGAAWYWSWPAYLMIFWTVLSLLTAIVHFVTIGVLATRS